MTDTAKLKLPVEMRKSRSRAQGGVWILTCRYCPWSALTGDKLTAQEEKASHTRTCYHYLKRLGLR